MFYLMRLLKHFQNTVKCVRKFDFLFILGAGYSALPIFYKAILKKFEKLLKVS